MDEIMKRIFETAADKGIKSPSVLARALNVSQQTLKNWEVRGPSKDGIVRAADILGTSVTYLLHGKNPLEMVNFRVEEPRREYFKKAIDGLIGYSENILNIPKSDATAGMGDGHPQPEHESLADYIRVNRSWVQSNFPGVNPAKLAALSAYGDSMEPTFSDGDTLIVDRGILTIKIDAVYVLSLNDELFIKRLQRRPDGIMMISDNKNYQPYLIHNGEREKFEVLGRVIWAWNGRKI